MHMKTYIRFTFGFRFFLCAYNTAIDKHKQQANPFETESRNYKETERKRNELMEKQEEVRGRVLVIPIPVQGHMNPMVQFSKRLVSKCKGLKVTVVAAFINPVQDEALLPGSISLHAIPFEPSDDGTDPTASVATYFLHFQKVVSLRLAELIRRQQFTCVIYDSLIPWALDVAKEQGLFAACFFTQSNAVNAIYYSVHEGLLKVPAEGSVSLPGLPPLEISDLPSFVYDSESYPASLGHAVDQFSNFRGADCIFVNTFDSLEEEVVKWMMTKQQEWPTVRNIGPSIPSVYLDKRVKDDRDYGVSLFEAQEERCMKWLESRGKESVVYVSFGSLAGLREEQMEEVAWGLKRSEREYLWVVREEELKKLPDAMLLQESQTDAEKGLIVKWCPQLQVLAHRAVGCFLTHCGWNSTLEALSLGVPMVAVPQWTDQTTNAKFVMDAWGVGIRVEVDSEGFFTRQEIEACIRDVMEGDRGLQIKTNSAKWKELAIQAADHGGTSDNNIQEFVQQLASAIRN